MLKQNGRIVRLALVLTALGMMLSTCDLLQSQKEKQPFKIGAILSITGGASFLGDPEKKTLEMLVEKTNREGGVNGHPLNLIIMDSQSNPARAAEAYEKLSQDNQVLAVIGPSTSGSTIEALPSTVKYETPLISCAASHKIIQHTYTKKPYDWVFKVAQSDSLAVEAIYSYLQSKGVKRIAVMSIKSGYGLSGLAELTRYAPDYGIAIIANVRYDAAEKEFRPLMAKIKQENPQAVVNWSIGPSQIAVVQAWKELNMGATMMFQSHGFGSLKNVQEAKGAAEGVYLPLGAVNIADILPEDHPQKQVTMQYAREFKQAFNEPVNSFGGHAWDAFYILVNALKEAGADKPGIRREIENTKNFVGQGGIFNMSISDHGGLDRTAFNMIVVKNDTWALAD